MTGFGFLTAGIVLALMSLPFMSAIMRDAGMASKAKSICFTLPVSATAGLRLIEED